MYALAGRITPDDTYALAKGTYAEMVKAGITTVGEFDYVHHSEALIAAAQRDRHPAHAARRLLRRGRVRRAA